MKQTIIIFLSLCAASTPHTILSINGMLYSRPMSASDKFAMKTMENQRELMTAVAAQDRTGILDALIFGHADVNATCPTRSLTPLALAAQSGFQDICEHLIHYSANVNHEGADGRTALEFAKTPAIFQFLIDCGARINNQDKMGYTKLIRATIQGNLELCTLLIEASRGTPQYG